jgi:anti-sigma B factor antagonist/stage II sporulation protein AA (anti-sigma F factor antagonist)
MGNMRFFTLQVEGSTLIVAPTGPVSNLSGHEMQPEVSELMALFQKEQCRDVLIDMEKASFFGSVLLGALNSIFRQVRQRAGKMAICNLSGVGLEVVHVARFDTLWAVYPTREAALRSLGS